MKVYNSNQIRHIFYLSMLVSLSLIDLLLGGWLVVGFVDWLFLEVGAERKCCSWIFPWKPVRYNAQQNTFDPNE